jgi:hypothetical protein
MREGRENKRKEEKRKDRPLQNHCCENLKS